MLVQASKGVTMLHHKYLKHKYVWLKNEIKIDYTLKE